jgi:cytidylate kinase
MSNSQTHSTASHRNLFEKYFNQVLHPETPTQVETGPYISISRDFGCMANNIAKKLCAELTKRNKSLNVKKKWDWLNNHILIESAKVLETPPSKIEYVFHSHKKTMMDEIVGAMSARYYKSDRKIRKTIIEVIRSIVKSGNVILVGRGGVAFAKDNPQSLHIKLIAPIEWRVDHISKNYNKTKTEALQHILEIDMERKYLIDSFMGYDTDLSIFDIVFNRKTVSEEEIITTIINMAESKGLIGRK